LVDLPLRPGPGEPFAARSPSEPVEAESQLLAAPLSPRATAFAADAAALLLMTAAALLAAMKAAGRAPGLAALGWSAAFVLYLSFFATVLPLTLFGRTLGMAIARLSAQPATDGRRLNSWESVRRWVGTLLTAATLGLALLWTGGHSEARTPADRLSGRPLVQEGNEEL
jgi:hypothetical protein